MRSRRLIIVLMIGCAVYFTALNKFLPNAQRNLNSQQFHIAVILHGLAITAFISLGYTLFVAFFTAEGKRFFAAFTEIELAKGIQRELVPAVSLAESGFEFYGVSLPSGAVGGDLLDVVRCGERWLAYVADVAGHGVRAGVLMSMIKASVRTRYESGDSGAKGLLESLNNVLFSLTDAASYATVAYLMLDRGSPVTFSLAGHVPIFHYRREQDVVEPQAVENFPLAMFERARFETGQLAAETGDVFAVVTDGLTELANDKGKRLAPIILSGHCESLGSARCGRLQSGYYRRVTGLVRRKMTGRCCWYGAGKRTASLEATGG